MSVPYYNFALIHTESDVQVISAQLSGVTPSEIVDPKEEHEDPDYIANLAQSEILYI